MHGSNERLKKGRGGREKRGAMTFRSTSWPRISRSRGANGRSIRGPPSGDGRSALKPQGATTPPKTSPGTPRPMIGPSHPQDRKPTARRCAEPPRSRACRAFRPQNKMVPSERCQDFPTRRHLGEPPPSRRGSSPASLSPRSESFRLRENRSWTDAFSNDERIRIRFDLADVFSVVAEGRFRLVPGESLRTEVFIRGHIRGNKNFSLDE